MSQYLPRHLHIYRYSFICLKATVFLHTLQGPSPISDTYYEISLYPAHEYSVSTSITNLHGPPTSNTSKNGVKYIQSHSSQANPKYDHSVPSIFPRDSRTSTQSPKVRPTIFTRENDLDQALFPMDGIPIRLGKKAPAGACPSDRDYPRGIRMGVAPFLFESLYAWRGDKPGGVAEETAC